MHVLRSRSVELSVSDDGGSVALTHRRTGVRWVLGPDTRLVDGSGKDGVPFALPAGRTPPYHPTTAHNLDPLGEHALQVTSRGPAGTLTLRYELLEDACRVTALAARSSVTACALPGAFRPEGVTSTPVALPRNQGVWHRGTGAAFRFNLRREGHGGWSMPFFAPAGEREALLHILEDEHDARIWFERGEDGRVVAAALQDPSRGRLGYDRRVLLRFVEPNVTSICRAYREYVQASGRFVPWAEKIEARPNLERLFGALMCFIGYCRDPDLDYAASLRALHAMGFERAFVYPLSIGNPVESFLMGGRPPIDIRDHLGLLEELGYLAASWMWTEDVPDVPEDLLIGADGRPGLGWRIEEQQWYRGCPVRQVALANRIQDERMAGHTAQHFDVTASRAGLECHHPDHPLDRREDAAWRCKILETAARRGCVVSSEGFWGWATPSCDVGSVKIALPLHDDWYPVPMTSLVYHDSCIHDWWEVDNYNNPRHRSQGGRGRAYFPLGGGWAPLQAAQDALAGWPPNVMPFGAQYAFVDGRAPETELYRFHLGMPEVQEALRLALPVAQLHRRIGKLACVDHETLAADGSVQATTFADGTRVVADLARGEWRCESD